MEICKECGNPKTPTVHELYEKLGACAGGDIVEEIRAENEGRYRSQRRSLLADFRRWLAGTMDR